MKFLKRGLKLAGFGLCFAVAFVALGFALLQSGAGQAWLAAEIGRALTMPGRQVTVRGLEGRVPFAMRVASIVFADADGPFLSIADARIDISAKDLLAGRVVLRRIAARSVTFARPSAGPSNNSSDDAAGLLKPLLPVALAQFEIQSLILGEPVLGTAMTLAVTGSGDVGGGHADADVMLRRIDGTDGAATLHLALGGTPLHLALDAAVSEPTGAVLASFLHRDDKLPLEVKLAGDGTLDRWEGNLSATAGTEASATAHLAIAGDEPHRLTLDGRAELAPLLPPELRPLAQGGIAIAAEAAFGADTLVLDRLAVSSAALRLTSQGRFARSTGAVAATASVALDDLAPLATPLEIALGGAGAIDVALSGALTRPQAEVALRLDHLVTPQGRIAAARATIALAAQGDPWTAPIALHGSGTLEGIVPDSGPLPAALGQTLAWRIAATVDAQHETVTADSIEISDGGARLAGTAAVSRDGAKGELRLTLADLAPFADGALAGAGDATASFAAAPDGSATAVVSGAIAGAKSGTAPLDRALGPSVAFAGTIRRRADGTIDASDLALDGAAAKAAGTGRRAPDGTITADFTATLPRLAALDPSLAGAVRATGHLEGPENALRGTVTIDAPALTAGGARIDALSARVALARLAPLDARIDGKLRLDGIDTVVSAEAAQAGATLQVRRLEASAGGARVDGTLDIRGARIDGTLHGRVADLAPFSAFAGTTLAGRAEFTARAAGERFELTLDGNSLGGAGATVQQLHLVAAIADPFARPSGHVEASVSGLAAGGVQLSMAKLAAKSGRAGHFTLDGEALGRVGERFTIATSAEIGIEGSAVDLRLARLVGALGGVNFALGAPLAANWQGTSGRFRGLVLKLGDGTLSGDGALDGSKLALHLVARGLPVHALARLGGRSADGALGFELTLAGTRAAPQGRLVVDGEQLRYAAAEPPDLAGLGLVIDAEWRNERLTFEGRLAGPKQAAIGWQGSMPLALDPERLAVHLPRTGAVAFHLEGDGELAALADILPLGEDRLAGHFTVEMRVGGTVGDPLATGRIAVADGRYESLATGAVLSGLNAELVGDREHLVLQRFAAGDGAGGTLSMSGAVDLAAASGPALAFSAEIKRFRALKRDEGSATASGKLTLAGSIAAPKVEAALTIDQAEIAVPERLPQSVRPVDAVAINSATGMTVTPEDAQPAVALVAVALNLTVDFPGKTFVRGRGLDSEWRGRVTIGGTSRQPILTGRLEVVHGTFDFIGKTFVVSSGTISFLGGAKIDPIIDIVTQAQSNDITAIVALTGTGTRPTIKLSSEPDLPRDEILSRLLFGTSMSQISAAQGLELASAAASLAGGDSLDVLGRIRRTLGLDRLSLGSAANGVVPGLGVPSLSGQPGQKGSGPATGLGTTPLAPGSATPGGSAAAGTALNAGKYVANGVYVGVSQGLDANSSTVTVEVDVARHITVDTEAGQSGGSGSGIGINWKLDY
jgi:translocation and assembly module TamB